MNRSYCCPIIGCPPHYPSGPGQKFNCVQKLICLLKSNDHPHSRHLLDHTFCNKLNLFWCTHCKCSTQFALRSRGTWWEIPFQQPPPTLTTVPRNPLQTYTDIIFTGPGSNYLHNNWNNGIVYIMDNYNNDPSHFHSTRRHFLHGNHKARFESILEQLITAILASHTTNNSKAFWWLLFHFDMLILAPTPKRLRDNMSIKSIIFQRLRDFQCRNIDSLLRSTRFSSNWNTTTPWPTSRRGKSAAQIAADSDNYCTAIARACTFNKIATITDSNMSIVDGLYPKPVPPLLHGPTHSQPIQDLHLLGNIFETIKQSGKNKGTGLLVDSIDTFISLIKKTNPSINSNLLHLFTIVYWGEKAPIMRHFFTDTYLFWLHKDPQDEKTSQPIGIPTAICWIIATHVALLPYNFVGGVPNGMDLIIKSMQLSIQIFIIAQQQRNKLPSHSAILLI